ncbi:hypothetical protein DFH28DRAFT_685642 [Melampsora americana]|nr:hypothetical protein DFH28DRAFT_685642 [Melampsora americana]
MNLTYIWLLISCRMIIIVKGEILKDISLLSTSEKDLKNSKLNYEPIPCYRRIKRRSFLNGMGCKGNHVVNGFRNSKAKKKTSSNKDNEGQESGSKPIPISTHESDQVHRTTKVKEEDLNDFFDGKQEARRRRRKKATERRVYVNSPDRITGIYSTQPKLIEPEIPKESLKDLGYEDILPKLFDTEVQKESLKELGHGDISPNPKPPSPWIIRLKKHHTKVREFMQELKKSFRSIVLNHGEPEMDRTRDKITSFFEKVWIWFKSIPKTYRVIFKSEPRTEDLPRDVDIFLLESKVMSPEEIQKNIESYLSLERLFSVDREKEILRKKMIKYLSFSEARHVKPRLEKDPELLGLTVPEISRALLIENLGMTIEDSNEIEKDRLDSILLLKFIDSLGKSQYAKITIERIKEKLKDDLFLEKIDQVTPSLSYLNFKLEEMEKVKESLEQGKSMDLGIRSARFNGDHLASSFINHQ